MSRFLLNGQDLYGNAPQTGDKVSVVDTEGIVGQAGSTTNSQALFDGVAGDLCDVKTNLPNLFPRSEQRVLGAKNRLKTPYKSSSLSSTRGMNFTEIEDGKININGTNDNTGNSNYALHGSWGSTSPIIPAGTYHVTTGLSDPDIKIDVCYNSTVLGTGNDFIVDAPNGISYINFYVMKGHAQITNLVAAPMIWAASDPDDTRVPFAMTNKELTDGKLDITDEQVLGAWNFLKPILTGATTVNGVTFTPNTDGSVKANGTASADIYLSTHEVTITNGGYFYLSGCPVGGSDGTYRGKLSDNISDYIFDKGGYNGGSIPNNAGKLYYQIKIWSGQQVSNIVFYPMLALKPNMLYAPYAYTNRQLTQVESYTVTVTFSDATQAQTNNTFIAKRVGNIVTLNGEMKLKKELAAGTNIDGSFSGLPAPLASTTNAAFTGTIVYSYNIGTNKGFRIRIPQTMANGTVFSYGIVYATSDI